MSRTTDTDMQLYITNANRPGAIVEVYIPDVGKYTLTGDRLSISAISQQLDKEHGVSRISDVSITLKNDSNRYSSAYSGSIFYERQVYKDWVRIISGWGPTWSTSPEVQFQGRIKDLLEGSDWKATMICYDALQDLNDAAVGPDQLSVLGTATCTIGETQVPGMAPGDIIEYLCDTLFSITWLNMDTLEEESALDASSLAAFNTATEGIKIGETTWPQGSKLFDMVTGIVKMVGGYVYTGKDGKINLYVYTPSQSPDSAVGQYSFVGGEDVKEPEILLSRRKLSADTVVNQVSWTYGQSGSGFSSEVDTESKAKYGLKILKLTTGWELRNNDTSLLDITSGRMLARFSEPAAVYDAKLSWLRNGDALAMDLTDVVAITEPSAAVMDEYVEAHRRVVNIDQQITTAVLYDTSALRGKFAFVSSEIDQRDGNGITADNFAANWLKRFGFVSDNDNAANPGFDADGNSDGDIDPALAPIDDWNNGIESHFVVW